MHRASETIGAIAAALAKAQLELANPERTLTATFTERDGRARDFRYASLAQGLDIVRKCLCRYEIAVMQTTAADQGQIMLTTLLVHGSGEWVSSCWPVCPLSEASHRTKGAALTYARRYGLFTLVGIAAEDDLDAPDLSGAIMAASPASQNGPPLGELASNGLSTTRDPGMQPVTARQRSGGRQQPLPPNTSGDLAHRLTSELEAIGDPDALADWAQRAIPLKNQLQKAEADQLEAAFLAKLGQPGGAVDDRAPNGSGEPTDETVLDHPLEPAAGNRSNTKTGLTVRKPVRERDRNHRRYVSSQPCLVCGRTPSDAHHVKFAEPIAMGRKVSDRFTVPLCRLHHRGLHRRGNERLWWNDQGIDPLSAAATLWKKTHEEPSDEPGPVPPSAQQCNRPDNKRLNGSAIRASRRQDKTKPIRPEAP
jgi:hypothetical protein